MGNFISMNSPLYRFTAKLTDILILNLLWIVFSLPIVTMGAATTAVYYVNLKMVKNEEEYILKSFLKSFKQNFKQSTIMWIVFFVFALVLGTNINILFLKAEDTNIFFQGITILAAILFLFCILYAFPLMARYHNSVGRTILNSLAISIRYILRTIIIIVFIAALVFIGLYSTTTLFFAIVFGVGVLTFVISSYMMKIFENLEHLHSKWQEEHPQD